MNELMSLIERTEAAEGITLQKYERYETKAVVMYYHAERNYAIVVYNLNEKGDWELQNINYDTTPQEAADTFAYLADRWEGK